MTSANMALVPSNPIHICSASRNEHEEQLKWERVFVVDPSKIPVPVETKEIDVLELLADQCEEEEAAENGYFEKDGFTRNEDRHQKGGRRAKTLYKGLTRRARAGKRRSHGIERVAVRERMSQIGDDYEGADVFFDSRKLAWDGYMKHVRTPVVGMMLRCVGMHWEETYNKVVSQFPGRKMYRIRSRRKEDMPKKNESVVDDGTQAKAWVGPDRRIGRVGSHLFWFEKSVRRIRVDAYGGYYFKDHESFPQGRPLTRQEVAKFNSFSEATRNEIFAMSPVARKVK